VPDVLGRGRRKRYAGNTSPGISKQVGDLISARVAQDCSAIPAVTWAGGRVTKKIYRKHEYAACSNVRINIYSINKKVRSRLEYREIKKSRKPAKKGSCNCEAHLSQMPPDSHYDKEKTEVPYCGGDVSRRRGI
jgi:hypothetical protein